MKENHRPWMLLKVCNGNSIGCRLNTSSLATDRLSSLGQVSLLLRKDILNVRTERRNWTELNWHGLVIDELTNGQAVMHYSRHCLTASVTTLMYASTNDLQWACPARPLHGAKTKSCPNLKLNMYMEATICHSPGKAGKTWKNQEISRWSGKN